MKLASLLFLGLVCVGCYSSTTFKARDGSSKSESTTLPVYAVTTVTDEPKSSWKVCSEENEGYVGAKPLCDEVAEASRPGALPVCGTPASMMLVIPYGGYGYGYGSSPTIVRTRCREPKSQ